MLKKHWWKGLGVLLLIYTFTFGLLTPLKPGIKSVNPSSTVSGEDLTVTVVGYNTAYQAGISKMRVWLKLDSVHAILASAVEASSDKILKVSFDLPSYLPFNGSVSPASLIIDDPINGAHVLPNAVFIRQDSTDLTAGQTAWRATEIQNLNKKAGITFPFRAILKETIRNTYFHVAIWFAMLFLFIAGVVRSIRFLRTRELNHDIWAATYTRVGILFGLLGVATGAVWAKFTWGAFWSWDIKQNMTAIALLIYLAYFVLRNSFEDEEQKARLSAAYNIFAFAMLIPLIYIIPRLTDSLHPGAGGNPAFGSEDLDNTMRMAFYPAIIGWSLLGFWISNLFGRWRILEEKNLSE